jgi:hypothetical protein
MADFSMNVDYGKPQNQMSLGDIVGLARGAQAYQQAEQLNPLALQKAQMEIEQAKKTNPLTVQKLAAETGTAQTGEKKSQLELDQSQFNLAGNLLSGLESRATALAKSGDKQTALKELKIAKEWMISSGIPEKPNGPFKVAEDALNKGNFDGYLATLENMRNTLAGASSRYSSSLPDTVEVNGVKYNRDKKTGVLTPITAAAPNVPNAPMAPNVPNAPAVQSNQGAAKVPLIRQDMPVSSGGIPQMNTQQQARYEEGQKVQAESIQLAQAASEAKQTSRKIKENIAAASGSAPGQALRSAGKFIAGSEQLDELIKNLADNQMRQAALMGASQATDQARQVVALANGSENITPQALAQIVQRADATSTALEKFNAGLNKFYEKAGPYNGAIHTRNFKQTWSENYDPRIFMVQNINSSDMSGAEKQIQLQAILKGTTEEERKSLARKATNIKRLEQGDF